MDPILIVLAVCLLTSATVGAWFFVRNRELMNRLHKSESSIANTTRLLIEKNVELFDQSFSQGKELSKKDDFVAIASHQLRTPLNEMLWGLDELIEDATSPELKTSYERILSSGKRMQKIIEDLLGFVQVNQEQKRRTVQPYEPDPVIISIVQRLKEDFKDSGVTLELHLAYGKTVNTIDAESFEMIASNLIENAYHYTPSGGHITVTTERDEKNTFTLHVADTGIGISGDLGQQLFTKFRRAPDAIARNKEGSGLGLYVIKTLLDLSGGKVDYESTPGKGTTFHVVLPQGEVKKM